MSVYTLKYYIDTCMDVEINILTMNRDGFLKFKSWNNDLKHVIDNGCRTD